MIFQRMQITSWNVPEFIQARAFIAEMKERRRFVLAITA
jgi:hypothetical protein